MRKTFFLALIVSLLAVGVFSCGNEEKKSITTPTNDSEMNSENENLELEKQKIVITYLQWCQRLITQDYEEALALIEKDSAALSDLNNMKYKWDDGKICYYDFSDIQAVLSESGLRNGMGWAQGNATIVDDQKKYQKKFTSSCSKENGQWLIKAIFFEE